MTTAIILQVLLFGIALSMDAFAVAITDGLIYKDINKKKAIFIAIVFGLMQALMPLIGYWIIAAIELAIGELAGKHAIEITCEVVVWIAFVLLVLIGSKMGYEGIKGVKHPEQRKPKLFSVKEVLLYGVITSIDALAVGFSLHAGNISTDSTIWLHVSIILVCTFVISLLGVLLGNFFNRLLKGKYEIASIIGGVILIALAIWVVTSHYLGI
ncbi:MAG: manganese efflux pump MntP family protein [Bacilli bacterium]|nr:manganese efflux pump MntP family protein [Bacilli bacterium]